MPPLEASFAEIDRGDPGGAQPARLAGLKPSQPAPVVFHHRPSRAARQLLLRRPAGGHHRPHSGGVGGVREAGWLGRRGGRAERMPGGP